MPEYPPTILDDIALLQRQVRELATAVASIPSDATQAPWLPIASFGAGWSDLAATDANYELVGVQVRPGARVSLRGGAIRTGSAWPGAGFTLLTLPADLWPPKKQGFDCGSPFGNGRAYVEVHTDGQIRVWGWSGGSTGAAGTAVSLDGITYRTA